MKIFHTARFNQAYDTGTVLVCIRGQVESTVRARLAVHLVRQPAILLMVVRSIVLLTVQECAHDGTSRSELCDIGAKCFPSPDLVLKKKSDMTHGLSPPVCLPLIDRPIVYYLWHFPGVFAYTSGVSGFKFTFRVLLLNRFRCPNGLAWVADSSLKSQSSLAASI